MYPRASGDLGNLDCSIILSGDPQKLHCRINITILDLIDNSNEYSILGPKSINKLE